MQAQAVDATNGIDPERGIIERELHDEATTSYLSVRFIPPNTARIFIRSARVQLAPAKGPTYLCPHESLVSLVISADTRAITTPEQSRTPGCTIPSLGR